MVPGLDQIRVIRHLDDLSNSLRVLEDVRADSFGTFEGDIRTQWLVERGLERCIQNVLDVSGHVLAALGGPVPDDYASVILELGKRGILPPEFASEIARMAGFRNILVHRYIEVDTKLVFDALQTRLDDFRAFARHIVSFLEANA